MTAKLSRLLVDSLGGDLDFGIGEYQDFDIGKNSIMRFIRNGVINSSDTGVDVILIINGNPVSLHGNSKNELVKPVQNMLKSASIRSVQSPDVRGGLRLLTTRLTDVDKLFQRIGELGHAGDDRDTVVTEIDTDMLDVMNSPDSDKSLVEDIWKSISIDPMYYALLVATRDAFNTNTLKLDEILTTLKKPITKESKLKEILAKLPNPAIRGEVMRNIKSITGSDLSEYISNEDIQQAKDIGLLEDLSISPMLNDDNSLISMNHNYKLDNKKKAIPIIEKGQRIMLK
jgi:hypothetical protein